MGNLHCLGGPARRGLTLRAVKTSVLLSVLFLVVYGTANWMTSVRADVPTWYATWELAIPFVPLLIVPYMSIDLFFVAAPFLCASRCEIAVLVRRLVFANVVAVIRSFGNAAANSGLYSEMEARRSISCSIGIFISSGD